MTLTIEFDTALETRVSLHAIAPHSVWQALLHLSEAPWSQYIPALYKRPSLQSVAVTGTAVVQLAVRRCQLHY